MQLDGSGSNILSVWRLRDFWDVNTAWCLCVVGSLVTVGIFTENTALTSLSRSHRIELCF